MKVIYVAGPFRGKTAWDVAENIRQAERLAIEVARAGAMPLCPHSNGGNFDGTCTDKFWLDGTQELLRRCDAVILTEDWERSVGAQGEHDLAEELGLPIFYDLDAMQAWLFS